MPDTDKAALLDTAITICAEFEKMTGMKTADIHALSQKDLSLKTGLTLKNIKKWAAANQTAQDLIK